MHGERLRYLSLCFFQDALSCLISLFLSFPRFIKTTFYGSAHSEQSYEYIPVYPSLRTESVASSCTSGFDLDFSPEAHEIQGHPCEIHETSDDSLSIVPNLVSLVSPSQYKPLRIPPILQDFPTRYYKYLPKFDGDSKNLIAEKHVQTFEHFSDLFEIEHDDVYMQDFTLSLQGDAKIWFKHLQPKSINTWEDFSCTFLDFLG